MQVITADALGICFGVRDALHTIQHLDNPAQVTILGQLVHNPLVTADLARRGFHMIDHLRAPAAVQTSRVVITAHGISNLHRQSLRNLHITDTTCPLVKKAHAAALDLARDGFFVLVIGKKDHVEVRGLTGDLPPGRFQIVEGQLGVTCYGEKRIGIMAQTTTIQSDALAIVQRVRHMNPDADVRFINTICQPTRDRQTALEKLLTQCDVIVVVGGPESNNTRQLAARARSAGLPTLHIQNPDQLSEKMFSPHQIIGLTAGTSTLPETISAIHQKLQSFHQLPAPVAV